MMDFKQWFKEGDTKEKVEGQINRLPSEVLKNIAKTFNSQGEVLKLRYVYTNCSQMTELFKLGFVSILEDVEVVEIFNSINQYVLDNMTEQYKDGWIGLVLTKNFTFNGELLIPVWTISTRVESEEVAINAYDRLYEAVTDIFNIGKVDVN